MTNPVSHESVVGIGKPFFNNLLLACTKDSKPVEALYYIVASQSDLSAGKPSPSAQLMKDEVESNWQGIASQLTRRL